MCKGIIVKTKRCTTWVEAKQILFDIASSHKEIFFRGHEDASWTLTSSLGRLIRVVGREHNWTEEKKETTREKMEEEIWCAFKNAYHRIPGGTPGAPPIKENFDNESLAFAQHYSLPTSLLDWSRSPYIAAFFAFAGNKRSVLLPAQEVAVFAFDWEIYELVLYYSSKEIVDPERIVPNKPADLSKFLYSVEQDNPPRIKKIEIKGNPNRRIVYQEGLFTRAYKIKDNIEAYLEEKESFAPETVLTKVIIPGTEQGESLRDLALMTINPVTLLSDAEGAAAAAFNSVFRFRLDWM